MSRVYYNPRNGAGMSYEEKVKWVYNVIAS